MGHLDRVKHNPIFCQCGTIKNPQSMFSRDDEERMQSSEEEKGGNEGVGEVVKKKKKKDVQNREKTKK